MTLERPRLPALTSLRFFAALHVCVFHMYSMKITNPRGWFRHIATIGYVGVSFFFVLSGFILVYTYAGRETSVREFWRARFARIYPAYLFSLLFTAPFYFYVCLKMHPMPIPFLVWPQQHLVAASSMVAVLIQSWVPGAALAWNAPAWSLSDEAFFYLLFPALLVWLAAKTQKSWIRIIAVCWALSLAACLMYVVLNPDHAAFVDDNSFLTWLSVLKFNPLVRLPEFVVGACCGLLFLRREADRIAERKWATPLVIGGLGYFAAVAALSSRIPYPVLHDAALTPAFVVIIYGLALRPAWSRVLEIAPLVLLGEASYSFYLLHSNVLGWVFQPTGEQLHPSVLKLAAGILVPIGVALMVYRWIEQPMRRKLRGKKPAASELVPAAAASA